MGVGAARACIGGCMDGELVLGLVLLDMLRRCGGGGVLCALWQLSVDAE